MKMYVPPCLGNTVASSAQQRPPARARSPDTSQTSRHTPQEPTARRMELAVMKIPDPTMVPVTKEVAPTEIFDQSQLTVMSPHYRQCSHQSRALAQPQHSSSYDTSRRKYKISALVCACVFKPGLHKLRAGENSRP